MPTRLSSGTGSGTARKGALTMKSKSGLKGGKGGDSPPQLIDARIAALGDWRGETLARVRGLVREAHA